MQNVDPSNRPNRPHISSVTSNFKEPETKLTECALNLFGAPRLIRLYCFTEFGVSAASVRGCLRSHVALRKGFFRNSDIFFETPEWPAKYGVIGPN